MSTEAPKRSSEADHKGQRTEHPSASLNEPALYTEAENIEESTPDEPALPPELSGKGFLRRGLARWLVMGGIRLLYRAWTRLAVSLFPENSRRASLAFAFGIPLPDQLNMSWITPHLAVGGRIHVSDIARLAGTGVTRVVDTRSEYRDDDQALAAHGIELLCLPTPDTHPLSMEELRRGAIWINAQIQQDHRVLVHCEHGVGRSVLLTAAALVEAGMSAHEAIDLIKRRRWQAAPNHRQMRRLQEFERDIRQAKSASAS